MSDVLWPLTIITVACLFTWTAHQWVATQQGPAAEMAALRYECGQAVARAETAADAFRAKANELTALEQRLALLERQLIDVSDLANRLDNRTAKTLPRWAGV